MVKCNLSVTSLRGCIDGAFPFFPAPLLKLRVFRQGTTTLSRRERWGEFFASNFPRHYELLQYFCHTTFGKGLHPLYLIALVCAIKVPTQVRSRQETFTGVIARNFAIS